MRARGRSIHPGPRRKPCSAETLVQGVVVPVRGMVRSGCLSYAGAATATATAAATAGRRPRVRCQAARR